MKKTVTTFRCVPRVGLDYTELRVVDLDLMEGANEAQMLAALNLYFAHQGIADAVYAVDVDSEGYLAIINDEAYTHRWGTALR